MNDRADVLGELLDERWSCRGFRPKPVDQVVLDRLLTMAQRSPSWCNTQPWHLAILQGDALEAARKGLVDYVASSPEAPDLAFPVQYAGRYLERRRECGWQLYDSVGVQKGDRTGSTAQALENFRFFGAPAVAIVTTEDDLGIYGAVDCGVYMGFFSLSAQALGLATILQASLAAYSTFFRDLLNLPINRKVVAGISFGYADMNHPTRAFQTSRSSIRDAATTVRDLQQRM